MSYPPNNIKVSEEERLNTIHALKLQESMKNRIKEINKQVDSLENQILTLLENGTEPTSCRISLAEAKSELRELDQYIEESEKW